jgi:hypothetical protein
LKATYHYPKPSQDQLLTEIRANDGRGRASIKKVIIVPKKLVNSIAA